MKRLLLLLALLFSLLSVTATPALAAGSLQQACKATNGANSPGSSAFCTAPEEKISGQTGVLYRVTKLISVLAGIAAVIMIIVSGIFFITADGEANKIASARSTLMGALIGLVIVAASQGILNFVLTKV